MIVVDSSALVAILEREVDAAVYARAIELADGLLISAVNVHETGVVLRIRRGLSALDRFWRFLVIENDFEIAAFDEIQARLALSAFDRYGKGIHPKARSILRTARPTPVASSVRAPLLFKGDDFSATDVEGCRVAGSSMKGIAASVGADAYQSPARTWASLSCASVIGIILIAKAWSFSYSPHSM